MLDDGAGNVRAAWLLVFYSSVACICGSLTIFFDRFWRWLHPSSQFSFENNNALLSGSLGFSGGVLLFTALYRLLPEALDRLMSDPMLKGDARTSQAALMIMFLSGVILCAGLNWLLHIATSQSIVHCMHDGGDVESNSDSNEVETQEHHSHNCGHHHDNDHEHNGHTQRHTHEHAQGHSPSPGQLDKEDPFQQQDSAKIAIKAVNPRQEHRDNGSEHTEGAPIATISENVPGALDTGSSHASSSTSTETTPLLSDQDHEHEQQHPSGRNVAAVSVTALPKSSSYHDPLTILDRTVKQLKGKVSRGKCLGYECAEGCEYNGTGHPCSVLKDSPASNTLYEVVVPLMPPPQDVSPSETSDESFEDTQHEEHEHYHHHVLTRYSHLLSIGIQTALAICVHKVPEGFLTFSTTRADKALGFNVFFALAIHNYVEGFTVAFPLFLAWRNYWYAISVASVLGAGSQPLGAALAYFLLKGSAVDESADFIFGAIISVTSGFMTVVSLQMFATSIQFGAQTSVVLRWVFTGMAVVGFTAVLTAGSEK